MIIPDSLKDEFVAYMRTFDEDALSDGAWLAILEEKADSFMKKHKLEGNPNLAMNQYLIWRS